MEGCSYIAKHDAKIDSPTLGVGRGQGYTGSCKKLEF